MLFPEFVKRALINNEAGKWKLINGIPNSVALQGKLPINLALRRGFEWA